MKLSLRILHNQHGDVMYELWGERGRVERGDFEVAYLDEIIDGRSVALISMQARGAYDLWDETRAAARARGIEYVNICG